MARWPGVILAVSALSFLGACHKDEGPPLPPVESMRLDLGQFPTAKQAVAADKANFGAAAGRVGLLNLALGVVLTPPRVVFAAALSAKPKLASGTWTWDFNASSDANQYHARLSAWYDGNASAGTFLNLEMKVTCTGCGVPTTDFVWYTGRFNTAGTDGSWQFFAPEIAQADQKLARIAYDVSSLTHRSLTFTNNRTDGNADAGDVIQYLRDGDLARVTVHDQVSPGGGSLDYVIEWSVSAGTGSLTVPDYNGGQKACWDASQVNTACL